MSDYYDNTVASYDSQINSNQQRINECNNRIRELEDDIEELRRIKVKVIDVDNAVTIAVNNTSTKVTNLPSVIANPFSVLKLNYFSKILDVIQGIDRSNAKGGIDNATSKIDLKIREFQREIENLKYRITQCNSNINSLSRQKRNYIAVATVPKLTAQQTKAEPAISKTAQKTKTTTKKSKKKQEVVL